MSMSPRLLHRLELILLCGLCCLLLVLLWAVQRAPFPPPRLLLLDAPGAWLALVAVVSITLTTGHSKHTPGHGILVAFLAACAALAAAPWVAATLLLLCLVVAQGRTALFGDRRMVSAGLVLAAAFVLMLRGVRRYDDPTAGAALDTLIFGLVLVAATLPILPWSQCATAQPRRFEALMRIIWLLPLMRLFLLGPWNTAWSVTTALIGGTIALWASLASLTRADHHSAYVARSCILPAMALATLGLASSAGIAACCFTIFAIAIMPQAIPAAHTRNNAAIQLSAISIFPLGASLIAAWMSIGAAAAAGSLVFAGLIWLAVVAWCVTTLIRPEPSSAPTNPGSVLPGLLGGILAPQIVTYGIQPVVEQLQGGLTAYGRVVPTRWIGIGMADSASRTVITAPTLASAGLLVVLGALCLLVLKAWPAIAEGVSQDQAIGEVPESAWQALCREVPWLPQERNDAPR